MAVLIGKCLLRQRLKEARMTQSQLSERVNISPQMISHYVNSRKTMSLLVAKMISDALNCSIEDLYEWEYVRNRQE